MLTYIRHSLIIKNVCRLLLPAVLFLCIFPAHYHLHHLFSTDSATHDYVVDLHVVAHDTEHSNHNDTHVFKALPDGVTKKLNNNITPQLFLILALTLVISAYYRSVHTTLEPTTPLRHIQRILSPPQRAPPLI